MYSCRTTSLFRVRKLVTQESVLPHQQILDALGIRGDRTFHFQQMLATMILFAGHTGTALILFLIFLQVQICISQTNHLCAPSSCGNLHNISSPFRLRGDPPNCGYPFYELVCEQNQTFLYLYSGKYLVKSINYKKSTIRVVDAGVIKDNCSSLPKHTLTQRNFTYGDPFAWIVSSNKESKKLLVYIKCPNPAKSPLYVNTAPCINGTYSYVLINDNMTNVQNLCTIELISKTSLWLRNFKNNISYMDIHKRLAYGFQLQWFGVKCIICRGKQRCNIDRPGSWNSCPSDNTAALIYNIKNAGGLILYEIQIYSGLLMIIIGALIGGRMMLCGLFVYAFLIYKWRRRHLSMYDNIEEFLHQQNNFMPIRYSYAEIKKMTYGFKDKLGEGGYGSVYKGKLRSGGLAAVKMLGKSSANGHEFINEVATIGRIHHVNVVRLIGFCVEGSKHALVYEFMPNGSLEKYVFSKEGNTPLSWGKMYEISLGVARGIEYLHRGCDMQILHFDIKPHNVLLDENFTPKVSDFGLAKLYPTNINTVILTAARGTMGYIAPELFYKSFGNVSYKADVYSFGMLLMEMAGKRKNMNPVAESSSENYFPSWVYKEIVDERLEIGDAAEDEKKIAKKMIIVALWCIQMKPNDRPSMNKVVEMLEEDIESLELPPMPVLFPEEPPVQHTDSADATGSRSMLLDSSESVSLIRNSG